MFIFRFSLWSYGISIVTVSLKILIYLEVRPVGAVLVTLLFLCCGSWRPLVVTIRICSIFWLHFQFLWHLSFVLLKQFSCIFTFINKRNTCIYCTPNRNMGRLVIMLGFHFLCSAFLQICDFEQKWWLWWKISTCANEALRNIWGG